LYAVTALDREVAATDKELAELLVRSGGGSVDDLAAAAIAAAVRQTQAETAASRLTQAQDALAGHGARTEVITAEVTTLDASRDGLVARAATAAADVAAAEATVTAARGAATSVAARVAALRSVHDAALDLVARRQAADAANAAAHESADERDGVLERFGFDDAADVARHRLSADEVGERASQVAEHRAKVAGAHLVLADESLVGVSDDIVDTTAAEEAAGQSANAATGATADRGAAEVREQAVRSAAHAAREAWDASRTVSDELVLVQRLFASMNGEPPNDRRMKLEDFVLAAKLEEIVAAANGRLTVMTQGRYLLQHSDSVLSGGRQSGLDIVVLDQHTGAPRPTASLSGGEKFLASLALALGLAETVTAQAGGITLDTLFIDEGFGSLDSDTLEIAMETLDGLRAGGRSVGVISHVTEMHERIPAKIEVEVVDGGWSTIR
jgi:exonuclease SbcC